MSKFLLFIIAAVTVMSFGQFAMLDQADVQVLAGLATPTTLEDKAVESRMALGEIAIDSRAPASVPTVEQ